jgi:ATP-dependent Lon protease
MSNDTPLAAANDPIESRELPEQLPLLPLRSDVVFPEMVAPLVVGRQRSIRLLDDVAMGDKLVALATQRDSEVDEPTLEDLFRTACAAAVLRMLKFPDGSTRIVVQGMARARIAEIIEQQPYLVARIEPIEEVVEEGVELDARVHQVTTLFKKVAELSEVSEELQAAAMSTHDPSYLADLLGSNLPFSMEEQQRLLAEANVQKRLELLAQLMMRQLQVLEISSKIQSEVGSELSKAQREHILRQQLKAIQKELGKEPAEPEVAELRKKIDQVGLSDEAHKEAERELERLGQMHPSSAEYGVVRTYLDWLVSLPWKKASRDRLDLRRARKVLDADHYNLEKVKERILEYLAVRKLKRDMRGPILCFVGPPGTGKTSLGRSIARSLGREFLRISLGGVHDEAEIRGHRRTYVGALPGRIIQSLRKGGTINPVFMLDEVDKLGADFRGDPASALLEVLDPEQNYSFRDHYLDVAFDLSRVMFLCTANVRDTIPPPLLDRMEVLELPGYSEEEKLAIAKNYLVPKQLKEHGLKGTHLKFEDAAIVRVVREYTREAGLRNLERELAAICRKVARRRAEGERKAARVDAPLVPEFLGPMKHFPEVADHSAVPGVSIALAWTPTGGDILFIEATAMKGKRGLTLTGSLGDVMKESAQAALSYIRSHAAELNVKADFFEKFDLHVHVPAGAIAKDGPSAGVALMAALVSLLRGEPLPPDLAMTGEITLTGRVLPVGGIREKLLAARRAGVKRVILPQRNEKDLVELPDETRRDLEVHLVESIGEVVPLLFSTPAAASRGRREEKPQAAQEVAGRVAVAGP